MAALYGIPELGRILELSKRLPVFPCGQNKKPLVRSGFHAATQDERQIRAWWAQWPDALVGVPTGQATGLVVLDYDPDKATQATHQWMSEHTDLLCSTRTHSTARGGKHYVFRTSDRYQTGTNLVLGGSPRHGIDLRANGGYVIWWPIHGGEVGEERAAPVPAGLIDERLFRPERDMAPLPEQAPAAWAGEVRKVLAALQHIRPDGYEQWIRVGMAIHQASGGSDEGFGIWHDWSTRGESYDGIEDCRYHWASFGRYQGRGVGLGTLFALAMANGYVDVPEPPQHELPPLEVYAAEVDAEPVLDLPEKPAPEGPLVLRPLAEIVAERREPEWLLDDVIEANILAVLAGPRGTFKSFVALDWSMRIAAVGQPVVILSGEGAGIDRRADAWVRTHGGGRGVDEFPVFVLERALNLNADADMVLLRAAIDRLGQLPALIVVDTFSKFSAGLDENDNGEVSTYLSRLSEYLRHAFRSTVLLVAHSGHADPKRPRGASALMANPDAEYVVDRPDPQAMQVAVSRERFKDCPALSPLGYEAQVIDLGREDKRGQPVTSLALIPAIPITRRSAETKGKVQKQLMAGLRNLQKDSKDRLFWSMAELRQVARGAGATKQAAHAAADALVLSGLLCPVAGGGYSLRVDEVKS